jgi:hypothetical protein
MKMARTVAVLQPGDMVTWKGKDQGPWHRVTLGPEHGGKTGYVIQTSLTPNHVGKDEWRVDPRCHQCNGYGFYVISHGVGHFAHVVPCDHPPPHPVGDGYGYPSFGQATKG